MFPLRDDNPTEIVPIFTVLIIAGTVAVWWYVQGAGLSPATLSTSICALGAIPAEVTGQLIRAGIRDAPCQLGGLTWQALVTSIFLHGSWMHLIGNMWFLWVFGDNVEDSMGHGRFAIFYVLCGLFAAAAQVFSQPDSAVPMVGASGAIGGVMGAYIMLYPRVKVTMLLFLVLIVTTFRVPAFAMLGYWIVVQLLGGLSSIGLDGGGTAFLAHVGGFVAGAILVWLFKDNELLRNHPHHGW